MKIKNHKPVIPLGFGLVCLVSVLGILLPCLRTFDGMETAWTFNVGADVLGMGVCAVLLYSILRDKEDADENAVLFAALLSANAMALFLDEGAWLVQGVPELRTLNILDNALFYCNSAVIVYFFWRYITSALDMESPLMQLADRGLLVLLFPALLLCLVNTVWPLYFSVDEAGVYRRGDYFFISYFYLAVALAVIIVGLLRSRAPKQQKWIALSFILIPLLNQVFTVGYFGISTQYAATLVSVVLIYGVLFSDRGKTLAATEKELNMAAGIQAHMLPSVFPAFPDRRDFDIYASMDPAKEVGGDFYDFFLIDDDRLGIVMADVSGKGVPAALFMMASKILIQNLAMLGKSPGETLRTANEQICANNREEMFVTVWFGVLDLRSGLLTAANAGHEYPILKPSGGSFALIKDKHGLVLGGQSGVRYKEYELRLEPGAKLFLYTDGVAEATDAAGTLFGTERLVEALKQVETLPPREVLAGVNRAVAAFVGDAPQFDDLTMLCLEYTGSEGGENGA